MPLFAVAGHLQSINPHLLVPRRGFLLVLLLVPGASLDVGDAHGGGLFLLVRHDEGRRKRGREREREMWKKKNRRKE